MTTRVQKWGNSLAVRIPRLVARETSLEAGTAVELTSRDGAVVIVPRARASYAVSDLLKRVTRGNLHGEAATGGPAGREVW